MKRWVLVAVGVTVVVVVLIVVIVPPVVILCKPFKSTFMTSCKNFKGPPTPPSSDCQRIWDSFQQAYVNKDPCTVSPEAYDPVITAAPVGVPCGQTMFWSNTTDVVHDFTKKSKHCFLTMEDTLLGSLLHKKKWCGKEGSDETFTSDCPKECADIPKDSFWQRASAAFAEAACGEVTAMLSGSIDTPFHPDSYFARFEVKRLKASRVSYLNVVLVTQEKFVTDCANPSLTNLRNQLDPGITYSCREVKQSQLKGCSAKPGNCGSCW